MHARILAVKGRQEVRYIFPMSDEPDPAVRRRYGDVGGTPGGLFDFAVGLSLLLLGAWLLLGLVVVQSGFGGLFGLSHDAFGVLLVPLFFGVALLFFSERSVLGWLLSIGAALAIFAGLLSDLHLFFRPTSLLATSAMLFMMAAGLGMVARSLRPH